MMLKCSGLWLADVWNLCMTASQWLHSFCRQTGLFVFPAQNAVLFIIFAKKAFLVLFLLCVRIEHTSYTNTRFRYLSNIVSFTHYIFIIHFEL